MRVENGNAISGFTYGFPAMTHFLGFCHALSRKLIEREITFTGCAVMAHEHQIHVYRPDKWTEFSFALTRNPLTQTGETAPIVEEGKMHFTVSLIIECEGIVIGNDEILQKLAVEIKTMALKQRLAGGRITDIADCYFVSTPTDAIATRKIIRPLLPGFFLADRSAYLQSHFEKMNQRNGNKTMLDAWLDFASLKYICEQQSDLEGEGTVEWKYQPKPQSGYLVPIQIGYKRISDCYAPDEVANTRDATIPFCFTEAVFSIGEWLGPGKVTDLEQIIWRYHYNDPYYLCQNGLQAQEEDDFAEFENFE
jgi:CRISPR-associated protein Csy2